MCNCFGKKRPDDKKDRDADNNKPTDATNLATPTPTSSLHVANLLEQGKLKEQFVREVEKMRRDYEGNYKEYHRALHEDERTMSQVDNTEFTEIIDLPCVKWKTASDVLKAKHYTLEKKVGKGGYGVVYKACFQSKNVSNVVACKVISYNKGSRRKLLKNLKSEVFVLEKFPHPNIVTLLDHFVIDDKAYIIMEFADAGSLNDLLEKEGALTESTAYEYFVQILKGIFYLHTFHIAHRDLKTDNVLLFTSKENPSVKTVKITDMGLSLQVYRPRDGFLKPGHYAGTKPYMAPEIFRSDIYREFESEYEDKNGFNPFMIDIWALGVLLFEMLCIETPFERIKDSAKIYEAQMNRNWSFPNDVKLSADVKDLIVAMLEPDAQLRIDPYGIWMHRWIQRNYVTNRGWKSTVVEKRPTKARKKSIVGSLIKFISK